MEGLSEMFTEFIQSLPNYSLAKEVVDSNSCGNSWLIGGTVYRGLAHMIHGSPMPSVDFDFIVGGLVSPLNIPERWELSSNRFGNPKIRGEGISIDLIPLDKVYSIVSRNLAPTIDNFLSGVPLTVQGIIYDVNSEHIIDGRGISDLLAKVVRVNHLSLAEYNAFKKGISLNDLIKRKADSLHFTLIYPD